MTIASKTRMLGFQYTRAGSPFVEVSTRADFDATEAHRFGAPFYGVGHEEAVVYPNIRFPVRFGAPFLEKTARTDINASEFDYSRLGSPFWVPLNGEEQPPPEFNATRFFLIF